MTFINRTNQTAPKHLAPSGKKRVLILTSVIILVIALLYIGLCAYVHFGKKVLPNTIVLGINLGGMTDTDARAATHSVVSSHYRDINISIRCSELTEQVVTVSGGDMGISDATYTAVTNRGRQSSFLGNGFHFLTALFTTQEYQPILLWPQESDNPANIALSTFDNLGGGRATTYETDQSSVIFHKGSPALAIDTENLKSEILAAIQNPPQSMSINVVPGVLQLIEPDFEEIYQNVYMAPADAYLDKTTKELIPSVMGISFSIDDARTQFENAPEGGTYTVPLVFTVPNLTTEALSAKLFADVLGKASTKCGGPQARWDNIELAAQFVNGTILLPGEQFSYNETCEPYTLSHGYKKAGAYVDGATKDTVAGGICQLSSTIYYTTLLANLETIERQRHMYNTGYLPVVGTDATVFSDSWDFKFKNNTDYPIKIESYMEKRNYGSHWVNVIIRGTNDTGIHGEPYSVTLSTTEPKTLYEPSDTVPVGGAPIKDTMRTAYRGIKVEVHQKLVDKNGDTISDTIIHIDSYSVRDATFFYNPADAARLGIDPATKLRNLTPVVSVPPAEPSPSVEPSSPVEISPPTVPSPTVTPSPSTEPLPSVEPTPTVEPAPSVTPPDVLDDLPSAEVN